MTNAKALVASGGSRLAGLDLLRLLAVLLVLGCHMEAMPSDWESPFRPFVAALLDNGARGVDLFFVLSGFLVSGLLFSEYRKCSNVSIKRFYARRAWRIYPPFFVMLALTYLFSRYALDNKPDDRQMFSEIFFLQSYVPGFWNHTWTLAVEEHFYLVMPLLLAAMVWKNRGAENPFRAIPWVVGFVMAAGLVVRLVNVLLRDEVNYYTHAFNTHLRIDSLFFGLMVAYFYHFHAEAFRRIAYPRRYGLMTVGVAMLALRCFVPLNIFYLQVCGFVQYYLGAAALMVGLLMCDIPKNRIVSWLAMLGTYSYSIYLWHMTVMAWAVPQMRGSISWPMRQAIYMVGAFVVGMAMAKIVEAPLLNLRDRWHPSKMAGNAVEKLEPSAELMRRLQAA